MSGDEGAIERIYRQYHLAFLEELPERLDRLDRLVAGLGKGGAGTGPLLEDLFRQVHNIKGSSATFGEHLVMAICHRMEDLLKALVDGTVAADGRPAGLLARFAELLREALALALEGGEDASALEQKLDRLDEEMAGRRLTALVVVNSRVLRQICREVLDELDVRRVDIEDPLVALQRAVSEPFGLIVASSELRLLKGEALIAAVKLSPDRPHLATTVLVSGSSAVPPRKRNTDPDHIIRRDTDFVRNLRRVVEAKLAERKARA